MEKECNNSVCIVKKPDKIQGNVIVMKDRLKMRKLKTFEDKLNQNEKLIWSYMIIKINKYEIRQQRRMILTNQSLMVFDEGVFLANFKALFTGTSLKRKVNIKHIDSIIYSEISNEFILVLSKDYDFRLTSVKRDDFIWYLLKIREHRCSKSVAPVSSLKFYVVDKAELIG